MILRYSTGLEDIKGIVMHFLGVKILGLVIVQNKIRQNL